MEATIWPILWYVVVGASVVMYTILDGFDLGVGSVHLFLARKDEERRIFLNAIGPVWDGNEVWLVIIMGALFAGFPTAYASLFSGFYTLFMILIAAIIFRAVAIEFRSKKPSKFWRTTWDSVFCFASILFAFTIGLTFGNLIQGIPFANLTYGIPLERSFEFVGTLKMFFRPYPVLVGITAVAVLAMHGIIYLFMKTEGELHTKLKRWILPSILVFALFYILTTVVTVFNFHYMVEPMLEDPYLFAFPLLAFLAFISIPVLARRDKDGWAFICSCLMILLLIVTSFLGMFPILVRSSLDPEIHSLTIYNSASTDTTLKILMTIVAIGLPLVFLYTSWAYHIFKGKVVLDETSY